MTQPKQKNPTVYNDNMITHKNRGLGRRYLFGLCQSIRLGWMRVGVCVTYHLHQK